MSAGLLSRGEGTDDPRRARPAALTQAQWGEQQEPADAVFRGFAQDLGLDMPAFDAAHHSPETLQRVRFDVDDGKALGVRGTPTFYVNGTQVPARGLKAALDDALTK
jgi:predicted DsbA family dithiol-disulfide isomerase